MGFRVLIVRLSPFPETIKSVTHQFLYGECARVLPDKDIDFAFFPTAGDRKKNIPLCGIKSHVPAKEFDLILIANSFTAELLNLPYLLKMAGIPYSSKQRSAQKTSPLIIMGGSNALASQSVLFSDDDALVDALYFGEGERNVEAIVRALSSVSETDNTSADIHSLAYSTLVSLQGKIDGLKVFSSAASVIHKAINRDTSTELLAHANQRLFDSPEATTARLFIAYGCPAFCTFCFEGWEHKPYREVPVSQLLEAAKEVREKTGADTLEITAYNFNTYSDVTPLFRELNKLFFQVNFMSQRADILAQHPELVPYEVASGKKQYTLGIEGISERMRSYYNKNLSQATALNTITQLLKQPIREIKLFYIISGLETHEDNEDYKQFLKKIAELKTTYNNGIRILCSFGLLVRMPFTPLQFEKLMLTREEWSPVVAMIRESTENAGYEFRLTYPYEEYFLSQTLALHSPYAGTTQQYFLAPLLCSMAEHNFIYDQGVAPEAWNYFCSQYASLFNKDILLDNTFVSKKDVSFPFAFPYLDCGTPRSVLYKRYLDATASTVEPSTSFPGKCPDNSSTATFNSTKNQPHETPMCLGAKCTGCGSCSPEQRTFLETHTLTLPSADDRAEILAIVKEKAQSQPVYIEVEINDSLLSETNCDSGTNNYSTLRVHQETKDAALLRTIFAKIPDASLVMTVRDSLFGSKQFIGKLPYWSGRTIYAVFPFSNKMRSTLYESLATAGYVVHDEPYVPELITYEITENDVASKSTGTINQSLHHKQLEKTAASLLDAMHMQYTLSRSGSIKSVFSITPKCLKKHVVISCVVESDTIKITGSSKVDLSPIIRGGFSVQISFIPEDQSYPDDNAA